MPVLARTFEATGMSTVMVSNMPYWAEKVGAPRTLAIEFPFGHILGPPGDRERQLRVIRQALAVLAEAQDAGAIVHSQERWPASPDEGMRLSRPAIPPPIGAEMGRHVGSFLRGLRRGRRYSSGPALPSADRTKEK